MSTMPKTPNPPTEFPRPLATVDLAIFTVRDDALQVLLARRAEAPFEGSWGLPGGIVDVTEDTDLEACARRKLREKTGLAAPYLEQLGSWGNRRRDPRGWSVTNVYFALMPSEGVRLTPGANTSEVRWTPVTDDGVDDRLAFDHGELLAAAIERLRSKVEYTSLPAYLLPDEFTLGELQRAYEIVLGRPVEKSAFRTRVRSASLVVEVPRMRTGPNRPAQLYRLKDRRNPVFFPRTFSPRSG
jgi:ADP-ribose pyrophosphatase YjhB (NUDIX family)